jgi:hypothetical protein
MHDRLGIRYMNCGDWVESCTAIVETYGGEFAIIRWAEEKHRERAPAHLPKPPRRDPIAA